MKEQLSNGPVTAVLTEDIDDVVTSFNIHYVDSLYAFPAVGQFRILVENEIMLVTAIEEDGEEVTLTVVRGVEGSTQPPHAAGSAVKNVLTKESLTQWNKDRLPWFDHQPAMNYLVNDEDERLSLGDFEGGFDTTYELYGAIVGEQMPSGEFLGWSYLYRARPTPPYTQIVAFYPYFAQVGTGVQMVAVGFFDSSSEEAYVIGVKPNGQVLSATVVDLISPPVPSVELTTSVQGVVWFKLEDDGTDLTVSFSYDGVVWIEVETIPYAAAFSTAPDSLAFGLFSDADSDTDPPLKAALIHWSRES